MTPFKGCSARDIGLLQDDFPKMISRAKPTASANGRTFQMVLIGGRPYFFLNNQPLLSSYASLFFCLYFCWGFTLSLTPQLKPTIPPSFWDILRFRLFSAQTIFEILILVVPTTSSHRVPLDRPALHGFQNENRRVTRPTEPSARWSGSCSMLEIPSKIQGFYHHVDYISLWIWSIIYQFVNW